MHNSNISMCGIIAIISKSNCISDLLNGIKQLQNRGYDSAGICLYDKNDNKKFYVKKYASTDELDSIALVESNLDTITSNIGIAHTRWGTHGRRMDKNAHPLISLCDFFSIIHNGVIENYNELKQNLLKEGYTFQSETDSEIIINMIEYNYLCNDKCNKTVIGAIKETLPMLEGTWGLAIMSLFEPNKIYCTRHGSPLLVGYDDDIIMVASEKAGFCNKVTNYFALENNDICELIYSDDKLEFKTIKEYEHKNLDKTEFCENPDPYDHWMIKEIYDQIESSKRAISNGGRLLDDNFVKLGGLDLYKENIMKLDNIILLGCGTSYNAAILGREYFHDLCDLNTVQIFDGAEFSERDIPRDGKTGLIFISQSGETRDLIRCIDIGKDKDLFMIGVINVVDSTIAREVDCGCYMNASREVSVASTKCFTSQLIILSMISLWIAQHKNINNEKRMRYIKDLRKLSNDIKNTLELIENKIKSMTSIFSNHSTYVLGKSKCYGIARETSLKIKEVSYIHAESYSMVSLKHGPFSLLCEDTPVIMFCTKSDYSTTVSVMEEINCRNAPILLITDNECQNRIKDLELSKNIHMLIIDNNEMYQEVLFVITMQLLAYYLALDRGNNPDRPRNLAKVCTTI